MSQWFMRKDLPDTYGFLDLQNKILEIAVYVSSLCEQNGIDYCLMGGSALGAKRHGGFIPWDDDLDFFMTPDNYEKFRSLFQQQGDHENFYLQEWGATDGMVTISKIRMNGTTYIEQTLRDLDIHHGIYLDIFILHTCPDAVLSRWHQCLWAKYVILKGMTLRPGYKRGDKFDLIISLLKIFPEKFLIRHGLRQVYKYRSRSTKCFCNFLGRAVFKQGIYKREFFEPTVQVPFETVKLRVPEKLHEFLTERFGDYMTPPPPEKIKKWQHAEEYYVDQDFREVLKDRTFTFQDENKLV